MKTCLLILGALGALLMMQPVPGSAWQPPTAKSMQAALEGCLKETTTNQSTDVDEVQTGLEFSEQPDYLRCLMTELGLWTDDEGLQSRRIAKLLAKHRMTTEVVVVTEYCNVRHRQDDLDQWAYDAYHCATAGRMGAWVAEFVKSLYSSKAIQ